MQRPWVFLFFVFLSNTLPAQPIRHSFCVQSEEYESFKATLVFESVDFGEQTAKYILTQQLEPKLKAQLRLFPYSSAISCECTNESCPELVLMANETNGVFKTRYAKKGENMPSAAVGTIDKIVAESKKIIDDPQAALKTAVKQGVKLLGELFD